MICPICGRDTPERYQEKHHLTPRCKKGKETILVCIDCGNQIHQIFSIQELTRTYNTLEALKGHSDIQTWARWIKNRGFGICMRGKKKK